MDIQFNPKGRKVDLRWCESLVDMQADPGEMVNLAAKNQYRTILLQHREYLRDFALKYGDNVAQSMLQGLP